MADYLRSPNLGCLIGYNDGTPGILMLSPVVAKAMAAVGWTKQSIRIPIGARQIPPRSGGAAASTPGSRPIAIRSCARAWRWIARPHSVRPENLVLLVAGSRHPTDSYWMEGYSPHVVGRRINVPADFARLLEQADRDIGCGAEACRI